MNSPQADSVHARLLNRARESGEDFNSLLIRYALERWLYRLSVSEERARLVLKGALLFSVWFDVPHRPTRDADFLGYGEADADVLRERIQAVCNVECDDGMRFDADSVRVEPIREGAFYEGLRATLLCWLGSARSKLQLDVGYGDAVTPDARMQCYPALLSGFPAPQLQVYPRETVIAEKVEAIITLGMRNSRMKDYFDLWTLLRRGGHNDALLAQAIRATCKRRGTPLPTSWPTGLTPIFANDDAKLTQWRAFLRKNGLKAPALAKVVVDLRAGLAQSLKLEKEADND